MLTEHGRTSTICLKDFYIRRAYRILPAAFVFLAAAVIIDWQEMTWIHVGAAVFYLADYDYALPWIFRHLWSLSVEEQFYLLWPAVLKRWYNKRVQILIGVSIFAPLLHLVLYAFKVSGGGDGLFPVLTDNLAIGCLLAVLEPHIPRIPGYIALPDDVCDRLHTALPGAHSPAHNFLGSYLASDFSHFHRRSHRARCPDAVSVPEPLADRLDRPH